MLTIPDAPPLSDYAYPGSHVNKAHITFEMLQMGFLQYFDLDGEPFLEGKEISSIEVDHDKRTISVYFQGDKARAEGQEVPPIHLSFNWERWVTDALKFKK